MLSESPYYRGDIKQQFKNQTKITENRVFKPDLKGTNADSLCKVAGKAFHIPGAVDLKALAPVAVWQNGLSSWLSSAIVNGLVHGFDQLVQIGRCLLTVSFEHRLDVIFLYLIVASVMIAVVL